MTDVYKYKVWCSTDSKWETLWSETLPTTCPTDTGHTIDSAKTHIIETKLDDEVKIKEETVKTIGDKVRLAGHVVNMTATSGWHPYDFSYPYPISIYDAVFVDSVEKAGDKCHFEISPKTTLGAITAAVAVNDEWITVAQSVIDNIFPGRIVVIDDGTNEEELGECLEIDDVGLRIKVETKPQNAYAVATPTLIKMTTRMVDEWFFEGVPVSIHLGEGVIGGSRIEANTPLCCNYYNSDGVAKKFRFALEIKY